jgi:hypothetical protein
MNALAPIPTETDAKPVKDPRLTAKLRKALHLLETGECTTQRAAAERALPLAEDRWNEQYSVRAVCRYRRH